MKLITAALTLQRLNISHLAEPDMDFKTSWRIKLQSSKVSTPIARGTEQLTYKIYGIN